MSDPSDPKPTAIPVWQREDSSASSSSSSSSPSPRPAGNTNHPNSQSPNAELQSSPVSLVEQASKFLQADEVKDAPVKRKISFLESKGLSKQEINGLLGLSQNEDVDADAMNETPIEQPQPDEDKPTHEGGEVKSSEDQSPTPISPPSQDIPPIITYPEFLLHTQKPPPLITITRLLTSLYVISGAAATVYGASNYIANPMIESLTSARHSFFENASSNLEALAKKLEQVVSVVPDTAGSRSSHLQDLDDSSVNSDPPELFHRSTATQTSPGLISSLSSTSSQASNPVSPLTDQHLRLQTLHTQLSDLLASNDTQTNSSQLMKLHVNDFQRYLNGLAYSNLMVQTGLPGEPSKEDAISKVKAEIRGVKGALLSARNFPSGVGTRGRS